jgi:uncharacterized membrane protein YsdA (DUF1294 family)/cold shock CspA family protein
MCQRDIMRFKGTLVEWNDARGFGFLEPAGGGQRAYCHISQFARRSRRPAIGDRVTYELSRDERGRPRASQIRPVAATKVAAAKKSSSLLSPWVAIVTAALFIAAVAGLAFRGALPILIPAIYLCLSFVTILAYAFDKSAAKNGRRRTQESTLHLLSLLGGWPGAWIAQLAFRHKIKKVSFMVTFVVCVVGNLAALGWLGMHPGALPVR